MKKWLLLFTPLFLNGCVPTGHSVHQQTGLHLKLSLCVFPEQDSKDTNTFVATLVGSSLTCRLELLDDRSTPNTTTYHISIPSADFWMTPSEQDIQVGKPIHFNAIRSPYQNRQEDQQLYIKLQQGAADRFHMMLHIKHP